MITLKTLPTATAQEVFDHIVNHLRTQKKQAYNNDVFVEDCVYRLECEGVVLRCAAGCLIADDEYRPEFDSGRYSWKKMIEKEWVPNNHNELIASLQLVHDAKMVLSWENSFKSVAQKYNLIYKPESRPDIEGLQF
jgi:hypothetical protein